jgi:hypothetical protein
MSVSNQSIRIRIDGVEEVNAAFLKAGADAQDIKELMDEVGTIVQRAAQPPVVSGQLAASVRSGAGKTKAIVAAGGVRTPYGPVVHYGWDRRNIAPNPFLVNALQKQQVAVYNKIDDGMRMLLKKNNLK